DPNRDYGFARVIPEVIDTMAISSKRLYEIADIFVEMTGEVSEPTAILQTAAWLYETMAKDEYEIASNFITYKKYVLALYDWANSCMNQKVLLDKIIIQPAADELPRATANVFEQFWFECKAFVASFFMDYTSIGFEGDANKTYDSTVTLWSTVSTTATRETMLILREYTDKYFTPDSNIGVNIEVVSAGLTEAILAGIGPDIAFMDASTAVSWGLRGGVEDVAVLEGYDKIKEEFDDALLEDIRVDGKVYGLPVAQSYNAVFYRADILKQLNLEVPQTWDEVIDILPLLQNQNMELGLTYYLSATVTTTSTATAGATTVVSSTTANNLANPYILIEQSGGKVYADDGMRVGVESIEVLAAFEKWCDFFTKYGTQPTFDITRFRLGEIPILVGDLFSTYNTLMGFAEVRGLWGMAPIFGTRMDDGSINRKNVVSVTNAIVIPDGCDDVNAAWEYLKWYAGYEGQSVLTREAISVTGNATTTKVSTANRQVLLEQPWTDKELEVFEVTLNDLVGISAYPGAYLVNSQINFAFYDVYNNGADAGISLLDRVNTMNKELSRKREEYGLDYYIIDYSGEYTEDKIVRQ
ncbi:MAG: extracellular solute-binding protein, partial [Ruminococcaceae bacterium]|nr:extracellular solute-binding protein [Oscillospiraceae bacterium]